MNVYDQSAGLFIRGLTNLNAQLTKAELHAATNGVAEAVLLNAALATEGRSSSATRDLHLFTLAAHVHWAAEGSKLAIAHLLGTPHVPDAIVEVSFLDLHRCLDATIAYLREIAAGDLERGLYRIIVIENPRGSMRFAGDQFLLEFAVPHFYYHVVTAYGILRNQGVQLTMADFLGSRGTN